MFQDPELRKTLRKKRRMISRSVQKQSAYQVLHQCIRLPHFAHAKKIGLYLHAFGEIETKQIIEYCFKKHKKVYLPIICNMNQQLRWVRITQTQFRNRRFSHHLLGMQEPMASRGLHVGHLDLLIMPLLACDHVGTRMGMGGGFYDRTLASAPHKSFRLGLAHQFQILEQPLVRNKWDQSLDALLTPDHFYTFRRHFSQ